PEERPKLSIDVKVERGAAPDAGFAAGTLAPTGSVAGGTRSAPAPALATLGDENVSLEKPLSTAALRLRHLVPYDAIAVYIAVGDILTPRLALGENVRQLSRLRVRMGEGLTGWVAETGNAIVNGNPTVEPGFVTGTQPRGVLRSALAIPLRDNGDVVGVLALYHLQADAFTSEHLRAAEPGCNELASAIRECLNRKQPEKIVEPALVSHLADADAAKNKPFRRQQLIPAK